jgi:AbrB family looped-hinge helix DNA binding protein
MPKVKTLGKGQIVIPVHIRKKYGIDTGTLMDVIDKDGIIYLIPPVKDPVSAGRGLLPSSPSLSKKLLKDRKKDFK